jgi:hypothetical protein
MKSAKLLGLDQGLTWANAQPHTAVSHADGQGLAVMRDPFREQNAADSHATLVRAAICVMRLRGLRANRSQWAEPEYDPERVRRLRLLTVA